MCADMRDAPLNGTCKFYTWSVPGAPVRVHLHLDVVREIQHYLEEPVTPFYRNVTRRSGLLLGKIDAHGYSEITDFQPLSTLQSTEIEAAIPGLESPTNELRAIGFFRTHDEGRFWLTADDLSLARAFFSHPKCVFLLIHPPRDGHATAGFFFWDAGQINADFCFLEFPFDATALVSADETTGNTDIPESRKAESAAVSSIDLLLPKAEGEGNRANLLLNSPTLELPEPATDPPPVAAKQQLLNTTGTDSLYSPITRKQPKARKSSWVGSAAFLVCILLVSSSASYWFRLQLRDNAGGLATESVRVPEGRLHQPALSTPNLNANPPRVTQPPPQSIESQNANTAATPHSATPMANPMPSNTTGVAVKSATPNTPVAGVSPATPLASEPIKTQTPTLLPLPQTITPEVPRPEATKDIRSTSAAVSTPASVPALENRSESTPPRPPRKVIPDATGYSPEIMGDPRNGNPDQHRRAASRDTSSSDHGRDQH
jgi:hypothetical protein